jgi:hypothetical protein
MPHSTTELIKILSAGVPAGEISDEQAYNLIVEDLYEFTTEEQVAAAQRVIEYFMYKITVVCVPVMRELAKRGSL